MFESISNALTEQGMNPEGTTYTVMGIQILLVLLGSWAANTVAKRFLLTGISFFVKRSRTTWDDTLLSHDVFGRLSHLAPALVIYISADLFAPYHNEIHRLAIVYIIIVALLALNAFLSALIDIYGTFEFSRQRPIKGYVQVVRIVLSVLAGIIAIATLMDQSPTLLLSGIGAMTAVLLLIFKDTILGLIASIQLSSNDMVQIGDWIEMPKYGADGDVIDITLYTVKVQNWDKTISTIPVNALINDAFKNWRGMSESGGRRIKRSISIDMNSCRFCDSAMLERFAKFQLISKYISDKKSELEKDNQEHGIDVSESVNGRTLTNLGTFRAYLVAYLRNHQQVSKEMTFLVRQLQPGSEGIPIEVYVFSTNQEWVAYEDIMADIFDHILAVIPRFDLRVYQNPTGADFRGLVSSQPK